MNTTITEGLPTFLTVRQFASKHPWISEKGLRQRIFKGTESGFDECVVRFGKRILLDEAKVFAWIEAQNKARGDE